MKFNSFTSHDVPKPSFLTDDLIQNLLKKVSGKYRYNIRIEIGIIILLLGLYFFMAYSFLNMSSGLLLTTNKSNQTIINSSKETLMYTDTEPTTTRDTVSVDQGTYIFLTHLRTHQCKVIDRYTIHTIPSISFFYGQEHSVFGSIRSFLKNTTTIIS